MENITEEKVISNLRQCPRFEKCDRNLCPLDLMLPERSGSESDKCRWMRERRSGTIVFKDKSGVERKFEATGSPQMPDGFLKYVPESNIKWLNEPSRKRWLKLNNFKVGCDTTTK